MPNHVINRITFDCPVERLKEILSAICYDDSSEAETTGIGTINFNKITPMPLSLDIESGSSTDRGINLYLTSVNPSVRYYGKDKMDPVAFTSLVESLNGSRSFLRHTPSMSSKGNPYDNAMAENFFSILKTECIHRVKLKTFEEARLLIGEYIRFYNNERIQTKTKLTPLEKRSQFTA